MTLVYNRDALYNLLHKLAYLPEVLGDIIFWYALPSVRWMDLESFPLSFERAWHNMMINSEFTSKIGSGYGFPQDIDDILWIQNGSAGRANYRLLFRVRDVPGFGFLTVRYGHDAAWCSDVVKLNWKTDLGELLGFIDRKCPQVMDDFWFGTKNGEQSDSCHTPEMCNPQLILEDRFILESID